MAEQAYRDQGPGLKNTVKGISSNVKGREQGARDIGPGFENLNGGTPGGFKTSDKGNTQTAKRGSNTRAPGQHG